jgi:predicted transcriptional regulator
LQFDGILGAQEFDLHLQMARSTLIAGSRIFGSTVFGSTSKRPLGPLEEQLLRELWARGSATVRELIDDRSVRQAYTTVMTTLDRLYKKGLLDRTAENRAFRYTPTFTAGELQRFAAVENIRQLLNSGSTASLPLSYLVEALSAHDAQLLDELQLLVERKRRELKRNETGNKHLAQPDRTRGPR